MWENVPANMYPMKMHMYKGTFPDVVAQYSSSHWALTLLLLSTTYPVLANNVDPDQLASEEANWSRSALFAIKYVNL